jgi:hypothetical protein
MKTKIEISTKKGYSQTTTWRIKRSLQHPTICRTGWQGAEGLLPQFGRMEGKPALPPSCTCELLRSDLVEEVGNRLDLAGFDGNPGAIVLRGQSLGEVVVKLGPCPYYRGGGWGADIWVRGHSERPTKGEREWIESHIVPALVAAIDAHRAQLAEMAKAELVAYVGRQVREERARLDELEEEMTRALEELA